MTPGRAEAAWARGRREPRSPGASRSAALGRVAPGSSSNRRCRLMPLEDRRKAGSGRRGWGARAVLLGPSPPHLQSQSGCQHAAGSEADGEAQEDEQPPAQELHHEHLAGGRRKSSRAEEAPALPAAGGPAPPVPGGSCRLGELPAGPTGPLLKGAACEDSPCVVRPQGCAREWPAGHGPAQSRGPTCSCHAVHLAQGVASRVMESHSTWRTLWNWDRVPGALHLHRAIDCLPQETSRRLSSAPR